MKKLLVLALVLVFILPATATVWGPGGRDDDDDDSGDSGGSSGSGTVDLLPMSEVPDGTVYYVPTNLSVKRSADFLNVLYMAFFSRTPDKSGYENNLSKLTSGTSRARLVVSFAESSENTRVRGSSTDINFVVTLYNTLLYRSPDQEGLSNYYNHLRRDSWSREKVAQKFLDGDEYAGKHVGAP
ncbi:DUF4214 domain-containing protein [bacterium]|nr:DUF4214 domain-containing protein [bacterium]